MRTFDIELRTMSTPATFARLLTLIGMAWFILWACAPTMSVPPARPLAHQSPAQRAQHGPSREYGMGGTASFFPSYGIVAAGSDVFTPLEESSDSSEHASDTSVQQEMTWDLGSPSMDSAHFYYRKATADGGEWGWSVQHYFPEAMPGAGVYRRLKAIHAGGLWAGLQYEGGWLYAGIRAPISLAFADRVWLTTAPGAAISAGGPSAQVPVGLSLRLGKRIFVDSEIGRSWGYDDMVYAGLSIGYGYTGETWLGAVE